MRLGLSREEFGCLTWAELDALFEAKDEQDRRTFGRLCATVANFAFVQNKRALREDDFYPDDSTPSEDRQQNVEDQIKFLSGIMGCGPEKPGTYHPKRAK